MSKTAYPGLALLVLVSACGDQPADLPATPPEMPGFTAPGLVQGRSIWMETCRACHLLGVGSAPGVADYPLWIPRLAKGRPALYRTVFQGVTDAAGNVLKPPRGGNTRLSDTQLKMAVDYTIAAVEYLGQGAGSPADR